MNKRFLLVAALFSAFVLTACGGGSDNTFLGASSDLTVEMNAANGPNTAAAVANETFVYTSGVPDFGTQNLPTTVTWTNTATTPSFLIEEDDHSATGTTEFGSCIFRVTSSTFPASSPLATGKVVTIATCRVIVRTRGQPADGNPRQRDIFLVLNAVTSQGTTATVSVDANGVVTVNGRVVGTVPVQQLTGGGAG